MTKKGAIVFTSSFAALAGGLLLFASFFKQFTFQPTITVNGLALMVKEDEKTLEYKLNYDITSDRQVSIRLKNEFFNIVYDLGKEEGNSFYYEGVFTSLTSKATYKVSILESNVAVYTESIVLKL